MIAVFLKLALGVLAVAAAARFFAYPRPRGRYCYLSRCAVAFAEAASDVLFPPGGEPVYSGREVGIPDFFERYFAALPRRTRVLFQALFCLFEHATLFFPAPGHLGWRRFSSLSPEQREAAIQSWHASRLYTRWLAFSSLAALFSIAYVSHPAVLRQLGLAPRATRTPIARADLLYPPIGRGPEAIAYTEADLTPPSDGTPLRVDAPLHPAFAEGFVRAPERIS